MSSVSYGEISLDRMVRAVEKVRERLQRVSAALNEAGIDYAVAGGNAVAAWVSRVDEAAVRNPRSAAGLTPPGRQSDPRCRSTSSRTIGIIRSANARLA